MNPKTFSKWHSLRFFLRKQLLLLTVVIVAGFAFLVFYIYVNGLDVATQKSLRVLGSYYAELHDKGEYDRVSLETDEFSLFIGQENLPAWLSSRFQQKTFDNHVLMKDRVNRREENTQFEGAEIVLMTAIPIENGHRQLFVAYHFKHGDPPDIIELVLKVVSGVFVVLLMAVFWIAHQFNHRVLKPMEALTEMANAVDESLPNSSHPILQDRSEVGQVAHSLQQGLQRIHRYHQREKEFLQNASHELRTPITVVGTALDLIERSQQLGKTDISQKLQHIRQACNTMRETTNALLWLSREFDTTEDRHPDRNTAYASKPTELCSNDISLLIESIVAELGYLIEGKAVDVKIEVDSLVEIKDPALIRIVLGNLIRNAFEHTFSGRVTVQLTANGLSVVDTGMGLDANKLWAQRGKSSRGSFGLGLDIVSRIAKKKNWSLILDNTLQGGCSASIDWGSQ